MGTVIGAGVFKAASVVDTHSQLVLAICLGVRWCLTICAGLTSAELATAIPETGGASSLYEHTYGNELKPFF